jgi:hypothetical protein
MRADVFALPNRGLDTADAPPNNSPPPDTCAAPQAVSPRRATAARGPNGVR